MDYNEEKELILEALANGDYEVNYKPTDGIEEREKWDGTKFYVFLDDDVKYGIDGGQCIIDVAGHCFRYDIMCDEWLEGETDDEDENDLINELIEDEEVDEALRDVEGFVDCDDYDGDKQFEIYAETNNIDPGAECYSIEDDDIPRDIDSFNYTEVSVPLRFGISSCHGSGEMTLASCRMNEMEFYQLYKYLTEVKGCDFSTCEDVFEEDEFAPFDEDSEHEEFGYKLNEDEADTLSDDELEKHFPKLYAKIAGQVQSCAEEMDAKQDLSFYLIFTREMFAYNLE